MESTRRGAASLAIGPDHVALAEAVRRFVAEQCPPSVARGALDAHDTGTPPFHKQLAELGWLGLHLPNAVGGEGFGLSEAAIVVEELGRAGAPGPLLPTFWAGTMLARTAAGRCHLRGFADGTTIGAVALGRGVGSHQSGDGSVTVTGTTVPVLGASEADLVVVAVDVEGTEQWWVAEKSAFTVHATEPLDPTRSLGTIEFTSATLPADAHLTDTDRDIVDAVVATLAAAEGAGIASWCVDIAAAYATERRQFGRPIGQFQAVKHRCANMLVATEAARAVVWDAAFALDAADAARESIDPTSADPARTADPTLIAEALLAAHIAAAITLDAAVRVAEDAIQVLGGVGFTWAHDAHLRLRRAVTLRQLLGGSGRRRQAVAHAALRGTRRRVRVDLPPEAESTRDRVGPEVDRVAALDVDAQRAGLVESGLLVPHWPAPWGRNAGAVEQLVIDQELRRAHVRRPHLQVGAWAAPTIVAHGTLDQQERWVRPTLLGTITWCQLFSEPDAGSDLASLRTAATQVEGGWRLDGQKVWTTMAAEADWGICLARTNPDAPKHLGITYLIVDMHTDGIEVRPLREMTGLTMFNEVFFDGVFVPDDCVIGDVDAGWPLARTTLGNERVAMGSGASFAGGVEGLLRLVTERRDAGALDVDAAVSERVGAVVAESHAVAMLGIRATLRSVAGAPPGPEASVRKLLGVEHDQRTQELGLDLLGPDGAAVVGDGAQWTFGFLANRCLTIAGGTSEIQRNVIGERLLGLPRDPEPGSP